MSSPLGDKIRARRTERKISLESLAAMTGSSKSYIWELENRENPRPSAEKLTRIADALGVTLEFLWESQSAVADSSVEDKAFFRRYQQMDESGKRKLRAMLDLWQDET
ncbi:MAG: helix-turn-helix transcriptional regulator [Bryocella sp.]